MAIPAFAVTNFKTLLKAAENGALALLECVDRASGEPRYVIVAVSEENGDYIFTPFGHLSNGNPFEDYLPPS